jgi:hypothetical protein
LFDKVLDLVELALELEALSLIQKVEGFLSANLVVFEILRSFEALLYGHVTEIRGGKKLREDDDGGSDPNAGSAVAAFSGNFRGNGFLDCFGLLRRFLCGHFANFKNKRA